MSKVDIFMRCIEIILKNEGGYCNVLDDPGGETNYGITKAGYPELDIKNITRNQAIQIYFRDYWSKMNLIGIKDESLILQIFDMGVNAGIGTAAKIIQGIVGADIDGQIGPQTTGLINTSKLKLTEAYKTERKKYYADIVRRKPKLQKFLQEWFNRVDNTKF